MLWTVTGSDGFDCLAWWNHPQICYLKCCWVHVQSQAKTFTSGLMVKHLNCSTMTLRKKKYLTPQILLLLNVPLWLFRVSRLAPNLTAGRSKSGQLYLLPQEKQHECITPGWVLMVAAGEKNGGVLGLKAGNPEIAKLGRSLGICTKVPPGILHAPEGQQTCANLIK